MGTGNKFNKISRMYRRTANRRKLILIAVLGLTLAACGNNEMGNANISETETNIQESTDTFETATETQESTSTSEENTNNNGQGDMKNNTDESTQINANDGNASSKNADNGKTMSKNANDGSASSQKTDNASDSTPTYISIDLEDDSLTQIEFASYLDAGWNLGNTMDATGGSGLSSETSWSQPKTTKELVEYVHNCGFTTIRIPVSWSNHLTDADNTIDPAWLDRVQEVADYAMDAGMFVVINTHHDNNLVENGTGYYPSEEYLDVSKKYVEDIWTQVAQRFQDYDGHLIFESLNEPRMKGTAKEWWFTATDNEGQATIRCINEMNQVFVDTVRSSGGNNAKRFLLVPSAMASPDNALSAAFVLPEDPANRTMVSVHAYSPYDFAGNENGYKTWGSDRVGDLYFIQRLYNKFVEKGIAVVIGEYGATNKDNLEDRVAWATDYRKLTKECGIPCFVWDNGGTGVGAENFGLIDRRNLDVFYPDLLQTYTE